MRKSIKKYSKFDSPEKFASTRKESLGIIKHGAKMGEGWLLTSEMLDLIHSGVNNIVCCQPFGCLPNHVVGRGVVKKIKEMYPDINKNMFTEFFQVLETFFGLLSKSVILFK